MSLKPNLDKVLATINEHKTVDDVCLVAVSKYSTISEVKDLYSCGQRDFGENRVEALEEKSLQAIELGLSDIRWHFIGNVQSSKINKISQVNGLVAIHSISSIKHLKKFYQEVKSPIDFFIQFNTSDEDEKSGITSLEQFEEYRKLISDNRNSSLQFKGLMTMGKLRGDDFESDARSCFSILSTIKNKLDSSLSLSMGMSRDYHIALQNGADYIRVGSMLFK